MWFTYLLILTVILLAGYSILIENYRNWFLSITPFSATGITAAPLHFSVIIPARNEEANLKRFLPFILNQQYPSSHFEVLVINDHSTDGTANVVKDFQRQFANLRLFNLEELMQGQRINSYKKKAIELAIIQANGSWIVTTDADCQVHPAWLATFAAFIQQHDAVFVAAPVKLINNGSFLSIFQSLDFLSLQGITAASVSQQFHSMCNGANLAYSKTIFNEAGGFAGIDSIASGDDMLLMHKIYTLRPNKVKYLLADHAIVQTTPMADWKSFINQRIRWASKASTYNDKRIFWVLALVYFMNVALLALLVAALFKHVLIISWLLLLTAKIMIELRLMVPVATFYGEEKLLKWFGLMQPVHIIYTVIAGWLGKFGSYNWKDRKVK